MRDKLIDIVNGALKEQFDFVPLDKVIKVADKLIENGVISPPCKVGDKIYRPQLHLSAYFDWEIEHIEIYADEIVFVDDSENYFTVDDIGKTVFLTKAEAEQKLEELKESEK